MLCFGPAERSEIRPLIDGVVSIGASSPAVESTLGGVTAPIACDRLRFGLSFSWEF